MGLYRRADLSGQDRRYRMRHQRKRLADVAHTVWFVEVLLLLLLVVVVLLLLVTVAERRELGQRHTAVSQCRNGPYA